MCPSNELCKENIKKGVVAVTANKFFSVGLSDDMKMNKFDDTPYTVVVFDEIYQIPASPVVVLNPSTGNISQGFLPPPFRTYYIPYTYYSYRLYDVGVF